MCSHFPRDDGIDGIIREPLEAKSNIVEIEFTPPSVEYAKGRSNMQRTGDKFGLRDHPTSEGK
jgi:hypothetical protein